MSKSTKVYGANAVYEAVSKLEAQGYEIISLDGCLLDDYICLSHDSTKYNFFFYEVALNCWSSGYKMQRFSARMPKFLQERLAEYVCSDCISEEDALDLTAKLTLANAL